MNTGNLPRPPVALLLDFDGVIVDSADIKIEFDSARALDVPFLGIVSERVVSPFPAGIVVWPSLEKRRRYESSSVTRSPETS